MAATISRTCTHCGMSKCWVDANRGPFWAAPIFTGRDGRDTCERCYQAGKDRPVEQLHTCRNCGNTWTEDGGAAEPGELEYEFCTGDCSEDFEAAEDELARQEYYERQSERPMRMGL